VQDKFCSKQTQHLRGPAKSQMTFDLQTILVQDQTFHLDPKGKSKRCHIDLNKLWVKLETVKDSTLVRLPPSEDTFKQHVLRSSYQTKIWLIGIAHIPKPAVAWLQRWKVWS
jgi:hypothetical protein